jgi:predicted RNase H-like nuclease (RuvC/YqgF family)
VNELLASIPSIVLALASGGLLGSVLVHRRLAPKTEAEKNDMDWTRFQREIARLDAKVEAQDRRIDELEGEVRACHVEKDELSAKLVRMEALMDVQGQARQLAAGVVALDRLEQKDNPK